MGCVLFVASLFFLSHVYASLTIAFVLAYLLEPIVAKLAGWGLKRTWGVPITLGVFFVVIGLGGMAIVPKILAQGRELVQRLPAVYLGATDALEPLSEKYLGYNAFTDVNKLVASLGSPTTLVEPLSGILQEVFSHTFRLVTAVLGLLIIPLMAYYLLRDFPSLYRKFVYVLPTRHHRMAAEIRNRLDQVLGGFIRGQLVVSTLLSVYYGAALALLGIKLAVVLGLMAGFFNVVPYLGILSVLTLTLLIALIHGVGGATLLGVVIVFAIGMSMEGSFLTPRIVGRKVGLSPLTLIVALLVGGELLGLVGMLLAVPLAAILNVFIGYALERYRASEVFTRVG